MQDGGKHKGLFIAKDNAGHGASAFKAFKPMAGNKMKLIGDLDEFGNFMTKHSSNLDKIYKYFGG